MAYGVPQRQRKRDSPIFGRDIMETYAVNCNRNAGYMIILDSRSRKWISDARRQGFTLIELLVTKVSEENGERHPPTCNASQARIQMKER